MSEQNGNSTHTLPGETQRLFRDVAELAEARYRLAELEIRHDVAAGRRLAIAGGVGAVLLLVGMPVLVVLLANAVGKWLGDDPMWWLLSFGLALCLCGGATMWTAWRRFRRNFSGLQQSLEELREDILWLREWTGKSSEGRE